MYKISLAKCACFVFIVILASFLSCSGFRIDSSAMAARNANHTRNNLNDSFTSARFSIIKNSDLLERLGGGGGDGGDGDDDASARRNEPPHRPRARRHVKGRNRRRKVSRTTTTTPAATVTGRIDAYVFARAQRSSPERKNQRHRAYHCQRQEVARKAYLANTVVRAKAESMSSNRVHNYSVTFRILERYKVSRFPIDDTLRLAFSSDTKDMNCEFEGRGRPHDLVKAQIQQSKEYYLFLDSRGMHNYSVVGMPVLKKKRNKRNRDLEDIRRVTSKNFVPKVLKKPKIKAIRTDDLKPGRRLRLICNVKGFPVPQVSWLKDNLHPNKRARITYKKKRTTLLINSIQVEDEGVYQCLAKGVDGTIAREEVTVRISNSEQGDGDECKDERYKENFCLNGGTCVRIMHKEIACQCPDGFTGERCGEKDVSNHSSMYGHNTFSCKLGLSTTYYC